MSTTKDTPSAPNSPAGGEAPPHPKGEILPPPHQPMPAGGMPRILAREMVVVSPWVSLIARTVDFGRGEPPEIYHAIQQPDYVCMWPMTPDKKTCLVRQYRPAIERFTLEFPAGLIDENEDPEVTCRRELREETGLRASRIHKVGHFAADVGRLGNHMHSYFVETEAPPTNFTPEPGISVEYVTFETLLDHVRDGSLSMQLHVGMIFLALLEPALTDILPIRLSGITPAQG